MYLQFKTKWIISRKRCIAKHSSPIKRNSNKRENGGSHRYVGNEIIYGAISAKNETQTKTTNNNVELLLTPLRKANLLITFLTLISKLVNRKTNIFPTWIKHENEVEYAI